MGDAPSRPLVLVVGADDRYAMPLAVTLYSTLTHLPEEIHARIHVLDGGISPVNRRRVERVVRDTRPTAELRWHVPNSVLLEGLPATLHLTSAAYLRLLIPEFLVDEEIVVYLDSDLLVRHDLSPLLREIGRLDGSALAAADDFRHADLGEALGDQSCIELGMDPRAPYFNSGVLVIDVEQWRDMRIAEQAFAFLREHESMVRYADQDALNVVFANLWHRLDPCWNVMLPQVWRYSAREGGSGLDGDGRTGDLESGAFIFHYGGHQKPWQARYEGSARQEYLNALGDSGWFEGTRELLFWRGKLAIRAVPWRAYRRLPEGFRAVVRSSPRLAERGDPGPESSPLDD